MNIKTAGRLSGAILALSGAALTIGAISASAHVATSSASCVANVPTGKTTATQYDGADFKAYDDGALIDSGHFQASLTKTYNLGDATKPHTYRMVIDAPGTQFDHDDTIHVAACVKPVDTTTAPTTQPATTAPATTAAPTTAAPTTAAPTTAAPTTIPATTPPTTAPTTTPATTAKTDPTTTPPTNSTPTTAGCTETPQETGTLVSCQMDTTTTAPATVTTPPTTTPAGNVCTDSVLHDSRGNVIIDKATGNPVQCLPGTGSNASFMVALGLLMILAGIGLVVLFKRKALPNPRK